ncbi:reverse transcriptase domain-containing protein [Tanacetum coccineum]
MYILGRQVNRVYLDEGSSCEVIYEHYFLKLKPSIRSLQVDSYTPLVGFSGEQSWPLGEIPLEIRIGEGPIAITKRLTFVIVKSDSPHNLLLGRTAMQQMGIVVSIVYGAIKFHMPRDRKTATNKNKDKATRSPKEIYGRLRMDLIPHNGAKEEKPSPRKEQSNPQPGRRIDRSGDLTRSEVPDMGIKSHGHEKRQWEMKAACRLHKHKQACIREPHPLPTAEQKAEGLHKYRLKCFLDAYKGYHHIPIAEEDEEKTSFFTREGVFDYKRLPFSLKNAGATYQRLIDKVFSHHMGRNMEVNVDDMVIMSDSEEEMMADIIETLERHRAINLKLNLKKCSFGVEEGVYSGHLITKQGIRADPFKVKAVSTLRPPKTVSEMQNLNKKIASLRRFLSKSAKRTLPFMKTLRSYTSGKMVQWTKEADEAFRRMKECLESLPTMVIPTKGETLTMYLATSEEIVSAVLMVERGKKQIPIYFLSRTLHGAELKYPELEKLILTLVYAAKKLRSKAGTPLSENREAKNEKVKRKEPGPKNAWKLFTDGASSSDGLGAGLMVVSPEGKEYTYALRFAFETTDNEAEYEALLVGLRIAKEMEIRELIIFVDSQLVANQVKGIFKARQPTIKQYLEKNDGSTIKFSQLLDQTH